MLWSLFRRYIAVGDLVMTDPAGRTQHGGDGTGPKVAVRLHGWRTPWRVALNPTLAIPEGYMEGRIVLEQGTIYDLLALIGRNFGHDPARRRHGPMRRGVFALLRWAGQINDRRTAHRNVSHHYDLSNALYSRFLDPDMQYSCAYFAQPGMTLEAAQAAKKAHIAAKLRLGPGQSVLDIGCGWGGLGLSLADAVPGGSVLGVTLSAQQLELAQGWAAARRASPSSGSVRFDFCDYRDLTDSFDRIVSVGMFEHVGRPNYQTFFDTVAARLKPDGVALIHAIGRRDEPGVTNPFIAKYIFPGGYIPALSEVLSAVERSGLWVTDVEVLRLHYAETLRAWRERFLAQWEEIAADYDERFCRMFEAYLALSEVAFRYGGHMVFQIQLAKQVDAVPLTRDYIGAAQREPDRRSGRQSAA